MPIGLHHTTTIQVKPTSKLLRRRQGLGHTHPVAYAVLTEEATQAAYPDFAYLTFQPQGHQAPPEITPGEEYLVTGAWHGEQCFHFHSAQPVA